MLSSAAHGQDTEEARGEQVSPEVSGGASGQTAPPLGGDSNGYLANTLRRLAGTQGLSGAVPASPFEEHDLQTNERADLNVQVEGGVCYVAVAAGMPSVRELDLYVIDPFGQQRARDSTQDASPSARFCPLVSGTWKIQIHLFNGYGRVAAQVLRVSQAGS